MAKKEHIGFPASHIIIIILLLVLIVGVFMVLKKMHMQSKTQSIKTTMTSPTITSASFRCDGAKTIQAEFFNNQVELQLSDGRSLLLSQALSGSGVRYTNWDESVTFWNKGNTAFMEEGPNSAETYNNCVDNTPVK